MGTQLRLPARWARNWISTPDPRDRLDAIIQAQLDVKAAIRGHFDGLADRFGIQRREVDRAMDSIDDTIGDLVYEVRGEIEEEIDRLGSE